MRLKILFFLSLIFVVKMNVFGLTYGGCDYSDISRLKALVTNINVSYSYYMENNTPYFNVNLTNITSDMYFRDTLTNKTYSYNDTDNGEINIIGYNQTSGSYKFYSALSDCYGISLGTKYYQFPAYNIYYDDEICSGIKNYSLCQKWIDVNYSYYEFVNILIFIIVICGAIILIRRRKNKFDL